MNSDVRRLVDRLWNYCNVLRDDGVSSFEYLEQLSCLVFLKMADQIEQADLAAKVPPEQRRRILPVGWEGRGWKELRVLTSDALEQAYTQLLEDLGTQGDEEHDEAERKPETTLSLIFHRARNRVQNPAHLRRLIVDLIDKEDWAGSKTEIKGAAYEALIERSAEDTKSGAGQYFTPRPLITAIVACMRPTPEDSITDPACGTGGFLLAAYEYIQREYQGKISDAQQDRLNSGAIHGTELVPSTARLAAMNFLLHGIGAADGKPLIKVEDALAAEVAEPVTMVLANPPFGTKSSISIDDGSGRKSRQDTRYRRSDFWVRTTNKQLNFIQHIAASMTAEGRAAVVVPDNVLYESVGKKIRQKLLTEFDLHTMLRLPDKIFYAGGVRANVLFFDAKPFRAGDEAAATSQLWVYDLRSGSKLTLKKNPLRDEHLSDFVEQYRAEEGGRRGKRTVTENFRPFDGTMLLEDPDVNLDIGLIEAPEDDAESSAAPLDLIRDISADLRAALSELDDLAQALGLAPPTFEQKTH